MTVVAHEPVQIGTPGGTSDVHPAACFAHPDDVLHHPVLTKAQKRAILSAWASDACAVAGSPALRRAPGADHAVRVDMILSALSRLDAPVVVSAPQRGWRARRAASGPAARLPLPARPTRRYLQRHVFRPPPELAALHGSS